MRDALDIIEQKESGGRNVPNYKYGPGFSASGNFQMINSTWKRWAKAAGIDISKYPRAIDAPYDLQRRVAAQGFKMEGFKPWVATKGLVGQEAQYSANPSRGGIITAQGAPAPPPRPVMGTGMQMPTGTEGTSTVPVAGTPSVSPGIARNREELERLLLGRYPELRVTSRDRDPTHNKKVGGAKGSQHLHGNALDISVRGLDPAKQEEITRYAQSVGAKGFGYYPGSSSMHFDTRPSGSAFWGPNYSKTSLGKTPDWFQRFASAPGDFPTGGTTQVAQASPDAATGTPPGIVAAQGEAPAAPAPAGADALSAALASVQAATQERAQRAQAVAQAQAPAPPLQQPGQPQGPAPAAGQPGQPSQPGQPDQVAAADLMTSLLERKRAGRIPPPTPQGLLSGWA